MAGYVVKAPLIVVANPENGGRDVYIYEGAPVPSAIPAERIKDLLASDLIKKAEEPPAESKGDGTPNKSASKADWKAYAISQGMDEAEAEATSRDDLAAKYLSA
jgi:hypothetical protein